MLDYWFDIKMHCFDVQLYFSFGGKRLTFKMSSDRRRRSLCADFSALSMEQGIPEEKLGSVNDVKEWEEARCPICMEHPHNAILLKCTSHGKGCRPYICNTNYWYASCVDQFCNSFVPDASRALHPCDISLQTKVVCPLCCGEIYGYFIVEPAIKFMNSKARSCSIEICDFIGTYSELRKHSRSEHSFRLYETRLEKEKCKEDSTFSELGVESSEERTFSIGLSDLTSSLVDCMNGISGEIDNNFNLSSNGMIPHWRFLPRLDYHRPPVIR